MRSINLKKRPMTILLISSIFLIALFFLLNSKHLYVIRLNHYIVADDEKMVEKLLKNPKDIDFSFRHVLDYTVSAPLEKAAWYGNPTIVKMLLESGAKADSWGLDGRNALFTACSINYDYETQKEIIVLLLEHGADVNRRGSTTTPFGFYLSNHGRERYQSYFDNDLDYPDIRQEKYEILLLFMEYGLDLEENGVYYLNSATSGRTMEVVIYLVEEAGVDVDIKGPNTGRTPLMNASRVNATEVVEYLLKQGADKNIQDDDGRTALGYAKKYNADEVIQLLEEKE